MNCSHVIEGHSNSVLSIKVNDNNLYTAAAGEYNILNNLAFWQPILIYSFVKSSPDRTVRIWDLEKSSGPVCLLSHPGPVVAIEYDRASNLLFSACGAFIKVWDPRSSHAKAVKILTSSGNTLSGTANLGLTHPGETPITALCMGASGNLYTAGSDKVRIWDLRK